MSRYEAASDGDPENITTKQLDAIREVVVNPLPLTDCPSRRSGQVFPKPIDGLFIAYNSAKNPTGGNIAGRSDYAINAGDQGGDNGTRRLLGNHFSRRRTNGQDELQFGDDLRLAHQRIGLDDSYRQPTARETVHGRQFSAQRSGDQTYYRRSSHTYLIGERFLDITDYETGRDGGDNETWCTGFNNDNFRMAFDPPAQDRVLPPVYVCCQANIFGSVHSAGFYMSWCDGHVELVGYDVDLQVHRANANRADDGQPNMIPPTALVVVSEATVRTPPSLATGCEASTRGKVKACFSIRHRVERH